MLLGAASLAIAAVCALVPLGATVVWVDHQTAGPFDCRANFDLSEQRRLLQQLTQLEPELQAALEIELSDELIEVLLFRDKSSYQQYLASRIPGAAHRPALYVKGEGPGRVYAHLSRDFATDLRHEGTHAILHACLPILPLWLDEGLAEYFEVPAESRLYGNPHLKSVRWAQRFSWRPHLATLENKREMAEMGGKEYRDSWAWVHFLLHGPPEARGVLVKYLADIQAGDPPGDLGDNLRRRLPNIEQRIVQHFKTWKSP
jgi:hypothetical protein